MKLFRQLLQCPRSIRIQALEVDANRHEFAFQLVSLSRRAKCPECNRVSQRIHSRYTRTISDLPWADWAVRLHLAVRKFICSNTKCSRRIFCERLESLALPWARKTRRLCDQLRHIVAVAGASSGAWLSHKLGYSASRNTLLRLIRATPKQSPVTPRVLGVDDWAKRKGRDYGTILVDLELISDISPIALGFDHNNTDGKRLDMLLVGQVVVHCNQDIENEGRLLSEAFRSSDYPILLQIR